MHPQVSLVRIFDHKSDWALIKIRGIQILGLETITLRNIL